MAGIRGPQVEPKTIETNRIIPDLAASLATVGDIDLTSTGQTTLYTVPAGTSKVLVLGVVIAATYANTVTVVPEVSIGVSPSTDDIFAVELLTGFDVTPETYTFWGNLNTGHIATTGESIILNVSTAATATGLVAAARLIGIEIST